MEKKNLVAVPYNNEWSDLGEWDAIWKKSRPSVEGGGFE